jgi:hypothetical protein
MTDGSIAKYELFSSISAFSGWRSKSLETNHLTTIRHIGRANTEIRLIAASHAECCEWRDKIEMQCQVAFQPQSVFDVASLSNNYFNKKSRVNCFTIIGKRNIILAML